MACPRLLGNSAGISNGKYLFAIVRDKPRHCSYTKRCLQYHFKSDIYFMNSDVHSTRPNYQKSHSRLRLADFPGRLLAAWIDMFLIFILLFLLNIAMPDLAKKLFFTRTSEEALGYPVWVLKNSAVFVVWVLYSVVMDFSLSQGTLGKQLLKIKVTDDNGNRISFIKSIKRNLSKFLSYAIIGIGFFWILFDKRKKSWHDLIAGTLVVRRIPKGFEKE